MFRWDPIVMVRICLYFIAGILAGIYLPGIISITSATVALVIVIILYLTFAIFQLTLQKTKWIIGTLGLFAVLLAGQVHVSKRTDSNNKDHLLYELDTIKYYEAILRSAPESKERSWKIEVEVLNVKTTKEWKRRSGRVVLYVSKSFLKTIPWMYGDRLVIKGTPSKVASPANPYEFDFKTFLSYRNIYHQHFLGKNQVIKIADTDTKGFIYYSHKARMWASGVINKFISGETERAIAMALILGVTEGIDTELQNAYAASGAMHVLAVSGLHVGIIYGLLIILLKPFQRFSWSKWLVFLISIFSLWLFAFVTGLSPSVLRAVTMFSFIALARPMGWRTNIYNTLAGSAFILLLYNPFLVMSVGFQLSYLAVLGIVYLQKPLYQLWTIENNVGSWVWEVTCISIAAQVSTFSLGMLYFHQFPVYFLLSNLFVIPLSIVVLVGGILLLAISSLTVIGTWVGFMLTALIKLLNWLVFTVEEWPFSTIEEIPLTTFQCWLIIAFLLGLVLTFEFKSLKPMYFSVVCSVIFLITQWSYFNNAVSNRQFIVYSIKGHSAIEWIEGRQSFFLTDSLLKHDADRLRFHVRPNRLNHGIKSVLDKVPFGKDYKGLQVYRWNNKLFVSLCERGKLNHVGSIDYLIVSNNSLEPESVHSIKVKTIILDGTNSMKYINRMKNVLKNSNVYSVLDDGAFILTI